MMIKEFRMEGLKVRVLLLLPKTNHLLLHNKLAMLCLKKVTAVSGVYNTGYGKVIRGFIQTFSVGARATDSHRRARQK